MHLKKFLATFALVFATGLLSSAEMAGPAFAQVPSIVAATPAQLRTYRAAFTALTPAAAATDIFTLSMGTTSQVQLRQIHCDGVSSGGTQSVLMQLIKRSTADTGGTSATPTSIALNSLQPASQATVKQYTANPTVGTAVGTLASGYLNTSALASPSFNNVGLTFDFTDQHLFLNSTPFQYSLAANAPTWNNGTQLACSMEWSEQ